MPNSSPRPPGPFIWCTLETTEPKGAQAFYTQVVGWTAMPMGAPPAPPSFPQAPSLLPPGGAQAASEPTPPPSSMGDDAFYTLWLMQGQAVGGVKALEPEARERGEGPAWRGYVAVDDVDATAERVLQAGGSVLVAPHDMPGVARFAVVADPGGARFVLMRPYGPPDHAFLPVTALGQVGWREVRNHQDEAVLDFYPQVLGWFRMEGMEVEGLGTYHLMSNGDQVVAGVLGPHEAGVRPYWLYYFNVPALDAALARVRSAGGSIVQAPVQVPSGQWAAHARDPQGALFALLAPTR